MPDDAALIKGVRVMFYVLISEAALYSKISCVLETFRPAMCNAVLGELLITPEVLLILGHLYYFQPLLYSRF